MHQAQGRVESIVREERLFLPSADFAARARIGSLEDYQRLYRQSIECPEEFWAGVAAQLHWFGQWNRVLEWLPPHAKWFVGGQTNLSYNCLDRQIDLGRGEKTAILWEGEPYEQGPGQRGSQTEVRRLSYRQLHAEVCRFANGLRKLGVKKGDRVTIYMPMTPEAAIAMLACARLGAVHSVIFGGFSSQAIAGRVQDAQSHVLITSDGGFRRGQVVPLKKNVDEALRGASIVQRVIVLKRTGEPINWVEGRDVWWHDVVAGQSEACPAEPMDSEDVLFLLYTSGSTDKPKGIVHTTGGYMVGAYLTSACVFDLREEDVYWCTADLGWVTGHSYVLYGPLLNGATTLIYEGAPDCPDYGRFWSIIERHGVSILYTAPTAIRAFMQAGREFPDAHDLSSLRLLGSVGEPINPEAWMWYHQVIGDGRCPIVDTWGQTETGAIMIAPLPGATPTKPGSATLPFFGVDVTVVDHEGREAPPGQAGLLVIRKPWPSMLRGVFGDHDRYVRQYWSDVPKAYFTGHGARRDAAGYFWITGRVDDVINVAGHRLGTMEIEGALAAHPAVAEVAVVGLPHELKGQCVAAFVTLASGYTPDEAMRAQLGAWVASQVGAVARPDQVHFTPALPKTRSGKIMRRLLKEAAGDGQVKGDTTTLEDLGPLAGIKADAPPAHPAEVPGRADPAAGRSDKSAPPPLVPHAPGLSSQNPAWA